MAKLKSNFGRIAALSPLVASEALLQTGADIVAILKQPGFTPRDTGELQDSYGAVPVSSHHLIVGTDVEHAPFVEFGTADQAAQPHFTVAMLQAEPTFKARLAESAKKCLG